MARFRPIQPAKGKSIAAIDFSRDLRNQLVVMFGGEDLVPTSVMRHKLRATNKEEDAAVADRGLYEKKVNGEYKSKDATLSKSQRRAFHISGSGCGSGALSRFPHEIGRSLLLLYTEPYCVVFDPFAGHNSRMEMCVKAGRNYIGCDLSTEFMKHNVKRAEFLRDRSKQSITLHHVDSRKVPVKSRSADFTITSPPYYDIEYYGDESEQLGKCDSYESFLDELQGVMRENFRVLKHGSHCVWFVNDFRKGGVFHSYHTDTIDRMRGVGFVHTDVVIVDLGRAIRDCFTSQIVKTKIIPKRHEYALVFQKPTKETNK